MSYLLRFINWLLGHRRVEPRTYNQAEKKLFGMIEEINRVQTIHNFAEITGWQNVVSNKKQGLLIFWHRIHGRMLVYPNTMTVSIPYKQRPKLGKTLQVYKDVNMAELATLFVNPRNHKSLRKSV